MMTDHKITFTGIILAVQPRIRMLRSFDQRSHNYLGYAIAVRGEMNAVQMDFSVGIGKSAQQKYGFCVGEGIAGECLPVQEPEMEPVEFYKASKLKKTAAQMQNNDAPPPWQIVPPDIEIYRERGHRRLAAVTYDKKCFTCIWGCRMPVEIIIDQWNQSRRKHRFETFCYGPLSCKFYKPGPTRKVEGRKGMVYEEEDWIDIDATSHRDPDE